MGAAANNFPRSKVSFSFLTFVGSFYTAIFVQICRSKPKCCEKSCSVLLTTFVIAPNRQTPQTRISLLRAKAAMLSARLSHLISVCLSVRPSVRHTGGSVKNDAS